ncbi:hypothetical protein RND81_01G173200, partial [Saponaria officinalis]
AINVSMHLVEALNVIFMGSHEFSPSYGNGCNASVLLDIDVSGENSTEKHNFMINKSLRGYEVIDEAKLLLEEECPMTVSCADIIAYAARDAANILGGITYKVPGGRRDGVVSISDEVFNLPNPFRKKSLTVKDLIVLSGAHSLGISHCISFKDKIYNFNQTHSMDSSMNLNFVDTLRSICPNTNTTTITVPMDFVSPNKLDSAYYRDIREHRVLFTLGQTLLDSRKTKTMVDHYASHGGAWKKDFANAMIRMGSIEVKVGEKGQIRSNCRLINK